ncbi:MAG: electron transport complex subunit RsxE [Bacteroidia bacterium]|nr:MAG: electron transport complex subunit RsxE [Bacteroidia bacterium]
MNKSKIFTKGFFKENAVFVMLLGLCPTLGTTTSALNGLGMGLATTFVLIMSNIVVSLIKSQIPDKVRIPAFIVIIASFVTIVQLLMQAYLPDLYDVLGLFIPLIVVNCLILGRAEAFASQNNTVDSILDGLGMGLGFAMALTILGSIREILGSLSIFGIKLPHIRLEKGAGAWQEAVAYVVNGIADNPALIFVMAPGAFIVLGYLIALLNKINTKD